MNFVDFKKDILLQEMVYFLDKNTVLDLHNLMEKSIHIKSCYAHKEKPKFSFKVINPSVTKLEASCKAIRDLLNKRDLNHKERTALMFLYIPLGEAGEKRLFEIMSIQNNFNYNKTKSQVDSYKQRGKFYGISCDKLKEWRVCNEKEC